MTKSKFIFFTCILFLVYMTFVHIYMIRQNKTIKMLIQTINTLNEGHDKFMKKVNLSNNMVGFKLNNCIVSSATDTFQLSTLLKNNVNIIFRFSNSSCFDCLKQQINILKTINDSSDCLLLSRFSNNRILNIFCKQEIKRNVYNLRSEDALFDNEDDNQPLLAIVNNRLEIIALYYCDELFNKYHQMLIPDIFLTNRKN